MMKKAQKMRENRQQVWAEIKKITASKVANSAVQVALNDAYQATNIKINNSAVNDKSILENLILAALNDANIQNAQVSTAKIKCNWGNEITCWHHTTPLMR